MLHCSTLTLVLIFSFKEFLYLLQRYLTYSVFVLVGRFVRTYVCMYLGVYLTSFKDLKTTLLIVRWICAKICDNRGYLRTSMKLGRVIEHDLSGGTSDLIFGDL